MVWVVVGGCVACTYECEFVCVCVCVMVCICAGLCVCVCVCAFLLAFRQWWLRCHLAYPPTHALTFTQPPSHALAPPQRIATETPKWAVEKRLKKKRQRSEVKRNRQRMPEW
jgi:hypothetical protein